VGVAIRRDHEVLPRIAWACGAGPARVARSREPPLVWLVDDDVGPGHGALLSQARLARRTGCGSHYRFHCTSVNGGVASSWGSKTASTDAPIVTSCIGSPVRLPIMRTWPASGSSTSTTTYGPCSRSAGCTGCQARSHE